MQFEQYLSEQDVTYEQYCLAFDYAFGRIDEGAFEAIKDKVTGLLTKIIERIRNDLLQIGTDYAMGMSDIVDAFKSKSFFSLFKSVGWSFGKLINAVNMFTKLAQDGLMSVFKAIHKTGGFQKLQSGAVKIDSFFERHPILAKVTGPAVAGLLFYIWLNMTFIGHMDYDFDFSNMAKALAGNFSLADLFASPEGLMLTTLFATGSFISAPWLGKVAYNLVLALVYTGLKNAKKKDLHHKAMQKMHSKIALVKV